MLKILIIFVLAILCVGCASSKANATPIKVQKPIKKGKYEKGCRMMPHGYLVCPKAVRT
jgi:hypothetical protein